MITNNQIKFVKSLHQSKFRQKYNKFIAEGDKICNEILQKSTYEYEAVYALDSWIEKNALIRSIDSNKIVGITKREMDKISTLKTSSPVLMVLDKKEDTLKTPLKSNAIYLDDVQDPGNVGTIIRIADWFGITAVIRSKGSADFYNPKVVQATMASFLSVDMITADFNDVIFENLTIVGAEMNGISPDKVQWNFPTLLVMGNESKGISDNVKNHLESSVTIPGNDNRIAESLNVGIATGIIVSSMISSQSK